VKEVLTSGVAGVAGIGLFEVGDVLGTDEAIRREFE
jgi:hypothetical protein